MAKVTTTVTDRGANRIMREVGVMKGKPFVKIGIQSNDAGKPKKMREGTFSKFNLIDIAVSHEFGIGVPQRSYLRATHDDKLRSRVKLTRKLIDKIIRGRITTSSALDVMGVQGQSEVRLAIAAGIDPPLAEETIKRKGSSKQLVDTGQLEESIQFEKVMNG